MDQLGPNDHSENLYKPSNGGNYRAFYTANVPGQRLTCPVAKFRLDRRTEVAIKWYLLSCDTIIIIIGTYYSIYVRL